MKGLYSSHYDKEKQKQQKDKKYSNSLHEIYTNSRDIKSRQEKRTNKSKDNKIINERKNVSYQKCLAMDFIIAYDTYIQICALLY